MAGRGMAPDGENRSPESEPSGSTGENGLKLQLFYKIMPYWRAFKFFVNRPRLLTQGYDKFTELWLALPFHNLRYRAGSVRNG